MNAITMAQQGMISAAASFDRASLSLQSAVTGQGPGDATAAVVDQTGAKTAFEASAGVLKTSQDMFKALLDITV
jgi:hypothetical protein